MVHIGVIAPISKLHIWALKKECHTVWGGGPWVAARGCGGRDETVTKESKAAKKSHFAAMSGLTARTKWWIGWWIVRSWCAADR